MDEQIMQALREREKALRCQREEARQAEMREKITRRLALYQQARDTLANDAATDDLIVHGLTAEAAVAYLDALIARLDRYLTSEPDQRA
jgi:hypothetical protein